MSGKTPGTWVLPGCAFEKTMEPFTVDGSLWFLPVSLPTRRLTASRSFYHKAGVDVHELRILAGLRASAYLSVGSSIEGPGAAGARLGLASARSRGADQAGHRNSRKAASSKRSQLPCTPSGAALYSNGGDEGWENGFGWTVGLPDTLWFVGASAITPQAFASPDRSSRRRCRDDGVDTGFSHSRRHRSYRGATNSPPYTSTSLLLSARIIVNVDWALAVGFVIAWLLGAATTAAGVAIGYLMWGHRSARATGSDDTAKAGPPGVRDRLPGAVPWRGDGGNSSG